jgi:hypothetical protein
MAATEKLNFRVPAEVRESLEALRAKLQAQTPYSNISLTDTFRYAVSSGHTVLGQELRSATGLSPEPQPIPAGMRYRVVGPDEPDTA